jgi:hypothetical protein
MTDSSSPPEDQRERAESASPPRSRGSRLGCLISGVVVVLLVAGIVWFVYSRAQENRQTGRRNQASVSVVTAPVQRGDLPVTINALGTVTPLATVTVKTQINGRLVSQWFTWPSRFWSVGPSISETVYDGGLRRAQTAEARAAFDASVATYRQTVLTAFQGVEDNLAALRILEEESRVQDEAVRAAQQSVELTMNQYRAGTVSYLNVITVQSIALSNQITAVQLLGRRLAAAVLLVQSLGGGWASSELPSPKAVSRP